MCPRNLNELSKAELIGELERLAGAPDRERLVHDLEVHQIELEMQNRELREAHDRLAEVSEKYRELYDFAPIGYCTLDPDGHVRDVNLKTAELLGAPRDDVTGRSFAALLPRESRPAFAEHIARCRRERVAVTSEIAIRSGGRIVQIVSEPIWQDHNAVAFRTSFVDISVLKQLERDLRLLSRAGETLAASLDTSDTLEVVAQIAVPALADLCMLDIVTDTGAIERPLVVFADPSKTELAERFRALASHPGWQSPQSRVIASGEPVLFEHVPDHGDRIAYDDRDVATLRAANLHSLVIVPLSARGRVLGALTLAVAESGRRFDTHDLEVALGLANRAAMTMDNTRLYTEARRASAARDSTLAVVAHDLRSPLQAILMRTEVHSTFDAGSLDAIHRAAERMERLIRDLVDVSSIEAGRLSIVPSPQDLAVLVGETLEAVRPAAGAKSLHVTSSVSSAPLDVACDRDRIEQVLGNLLGNAIKFAAAGGTIAVRAERRGAELQVTVADDGPGIAAAELPHVFDRYWQATATAHLGHGLGLAIARGIVEAHGGRIWAESRVGQGSTFFFTLPAGQRASRPIAAAAAPPAAERASAARKTILIVDDDTDLQRAVAEGLERAGYDVATASHGAGALAYLERAPMPALILLDLEMPEMSGWELLAQLDRDHARREIPVIVLSARREAAAQLAKLHIRHLAKPVATVDLLAEIARAIHRPRDHSLQYV